MGGEELKWHQLAHHNRPYIRCSVQESLHREPPEVGLVEKVSGSLYCWVELGVIESATTLSDTKPSL